MLCLLPEGRKLVPVAHPLLCVEAAPQTPRPARFLAQLSTEAGGMSSHSRPWLPAKLMGAGEGVEQQGCKLGQRCQQGDEHQSQWGTRPAFLGAALAARPWPTRGPRHLHEPSPQGTLGRRDESLHTAQRPRPPPARQTPLWALVKPAQAALRVGEGTDVCPRKLRHRGAKGFLAPEGRGLALGQGAKVYLKFSLVCLNLFNWSYRFNPYGNNHFKG